MERDSGAGALLGGFIGAAVALYLVVMVLATALLTACNDGLAVLDILLGAYLTPGAPWLAWALSGAAVGGTIGFWTLAPVYGIRGSHRRRLLTLAAAGIAGVGMLGWVG